MSIDKTRGFLYRLARLLGDVSAVSSSSPKKMARRVGRRTARPGHGKSDAQTVKIVKWIVYIRLSIIMIKERNMAWEWVTVL